MRSSPDAGSLPLELARCLPCMAAVDGISIVFYIVLVHMTMPTAVAAEDHSRIQQLLQSGSTDRGQQSTPAGELAMANG